MSESPLRKPSARPPVPPDAELVLENLLGAILVLSTDDRVRLVNPAAESLLGRSGRSLLGEPVEGVFASAAWIRELVERLKTAPEASLRDEGPLPGRSDVVAVVSVLREHDGTPAGTLIALHDLGPRQRMHSDELARTRLAELDRLVASVGHELNNPLSGLRGAAQLLGEKLADRPELVEYSEMIVRQADRMADLVHVLMSLEAPLPAMSPLNIHRVLNDVILLERTPASERGVELTTEFDPSLPEIMGNGDQLGQLFLNLLKNALAVCPDGRGRVHVMTRMENRFYVETESRRLRYIAVEISDDGPGLDEETLAHMFTPFFSRTPGGHGLGLTIARNIATSHKGHLRAENRQGGGACFRVTLPVAETRDGS